jgi:hypothetical protein
MHFILGIILVIAVMCLLGYLFEDPIQKVDDWIKRNNL